MRRVLAFAVLALVAFAAPAAAHGDAGVLKLEVTNDGTEYTFQARLTYDNDGEPADAGATVTLSIAGQDAGPPKTMTEGDPGEFSATVNLGTPGTYTATVTSETPAATTEETITVPDAGSSTTATTETPTTEKPEVSTTSAANDDDGEKDDDVPWLGIVAALLAVVVAIALVIVFVKRRGQDRKDPPAGTPSPPASGSATG